MVVRGYLENLTGWSIGPHPGEASFTEDGDPADEAADLYDKLEKVIIPTFYGDREKWIDIMKHCIAIQWQFLQHRENGAAVYRKCIYELIC